MNIELIQLTDEIVTLVAQVVTIIFSIGIAIYTFQFLIMRENIDKVPKVVMGQHKRLSGKILRLFFTGATAILYAVVVKVTISQFVLSTFVLWIVLSGSIILLLAIFFFLYTIFPEIGLVDG